MKLRIVFMGTPAFAVPSLDILIKNGYNVVGVVTATDKYGGRGGKRLIESDIKKYATARGIPVLQPSKLKSPDFLEQLRALRANLQVVVAFRMLPEVVWAMPAIGTFNLHGSLLPRYRGAAPINWAVIKGDQETGVTTFFLKQKVDTGDMILQKRMSIGANDTAGQVHDQMMELGASAVLETVQLIEQERVQLQPQDNSLATKAPKIFHETCEINFDQPAHQVHNFIRGLSPYPTAWTNLHDKKLKIFETRPLVATHELSPGTFVPSDDKKMLRIATSDGFVQILELQLAGKKRMTTTAFLNGYQDF
ncbi:MAG: methionyl-tRNA formyltransferase [Bacteroidota bacterium]